METVELSDTVTKIGKQAFSDCTNLKSFDLKNVKEIESAAFYNTTFDTIDITNVEKLGGSVFGGSSISEISLPEGITVIEGLFINCSKLKEIIIPNSVTQIDDWSFKGCTSLESIRIPNSVTSIDRAAFNYINSDATIYCETQRVANMLKAGTNYMPGSVNVVVDESMFS